MIEGLLAQGSKKGSKKDDKQVYLFLVKNTKNADNEAILSCGKFLVSVSDGRVQIPSAPLYKYNSNNQRTLFRPLRLLKFTPNFSVTVITFHT